MELCNATVLWVHDLEGNSWVIVTTKEWRKQICFFIMSANTGHFIVFCGVLLMIIRLSSYFDIAVVVV